MQITSRAGYLIALALAFLATRAEAADFGETTTSSSSVQFFVHGADWADLHYQVNGGTQLNVRMTPNGTNHSYDVTGLSNGATVRYFFTVGASTGAFDTAWTTFTFSGTTFNNTVKINLNSGNDSLSLTSVTATAQFWPPRVCP